MKLAERTTLRVGGPADSWIVAESDDQLAEAVRECDDLQTPVLLIGDGSNLVASDDGFRGTAIEVATRGRQVVVGDTFVDVRLAAGEPWDDLVAEAVAEGWSGVEALSGIPGRVGAAPFQNIGAYGQEVASVLVDVDVLDRASGDLSRLSRADCGFGYRTSAFKREPDRWVILGVQVRLSRATDGPARYAELASRLGVHLDDKAPIVSIREAVLELRAAKGMVLDASDHDTWSAGSFFTNPVVQSPAGLPPDCPRYPAVGGTKLSAAWLIEHSGIHRGFALDEPATAAISTKHTLAITNRGLATCADVMRLAGTVQSRVRERFGIDLEVEPAVVG